MNYHVSKAAIRESIVASELPLTSDNIYSEIQKDLIRPIFVSSMMASDTFLRDWALAGERDAGQIVKYLREVKVRYGAFTSFFVSERTRTYYQCRRRYAGPADRARRQGALRSQAEGPQPRPFRGLGIPRRVKIGSVSPFARVGTRMFAPP